jgi:hypothetical protein
MDYDQQEWKKEEDVAKPTEAEAAALPDDVTMKDD